MTLKTAKVNSYAIWFLTSFFSWIAKITYFIPMVSDICRSSSAIWVIMVELVLWVSMLGLSVNFILFYLLWFLIVLFCSHCFISIWFFKWRQVASIESNVCLSVGLSVEIFFQNQNNQKIKRIKFDYLILFFIFLWRASPSRSYNYLNKLIKK